MKLLSFGEIIWDVFPDAAHIGGAPLNFAAHAAMQGAEAYILSAVGEDELGAKAIEEIKALGVATDCISVAKKPTGRCIVTLDKNAVPAYNLLRDTAYDCIALPDISSGDGFDALSFGTLALRGEHNLKTVKELMEKVAFPEIFSDLNIRAPFYSKESITFCLENATIAKISDEELGVVTDAVFGCELAVEEAVLRLAEKYTQLKIIIVTCGAKGAYAYHTVAKQSYSCPAAPVTAVSTVGAGDSFGATFLTQYFDGKDIPRCLEIASSVSGFVVSKTGAVPKYDINGFI